MVDYAKFNSKIYLFLSQGDWKTNADYSGDGTITKKEFSDYLKSDAAKEVWDGENSSESRKNDVINRFWNQFDVVKSGTIITNSGKVKEYNALNDDEEAALEKSFAAYKYFNEYFNEEISNIQSSLSSVLNTDSQKELKTYLKSELLSLFEKEVSKGTEFSSVEDVKAALGDEARKTEYEAIANISIELFIKEKYGDLQQKYGYNREDDATLNALIKNCVEKLTSSSTENDFSGIFDEAKTVMQLYLNTAFKPTQLADLTLRGIYGYDFKDSDKLNALQEAVLKTNLKNQIAEDTEYKYGEAYENYPYVFDILSTAYVDSITYGDYRDMKLNENALKDFHEKMGTKIQNALNVAKLFDKPAENASSDAIEKKLWDRLKSEKGYSEELIAYLQGTGASELDEIKKDAITKTVDDEFGVGEKFNINDVVDYIIEQIDALKTDFEKKMNGADNLTVADSTWTVNITSTTNGTSSTSGSSSTNGASDSTKSYDLAKSKETAKKVVENIGELDANQIVGQDGSKTTGYNENFLNTLKNVFGGTGYDYKARIDNYTTIEELTAAMDKLMAKYPKYEGDWAPVEASTSTEDSGKTTGATSPSTNSGVTTQKGFNLSNTLTCHKGSTVTFQLNPKFLYKGTEKEAILDSNKKVTYECTDNTGLVSIDSSGNVTINPDKANLGKVTTEIRILLDGQVVGTKKLTIEVKEKEYNKTIDFAAAGINSTNSTTDIDVNGKIDGSDKKEDFKTELPNKVHGDQTVIKNYIDTICSKLKNNSGLDQNALETAITRLKNLYSSALDKMYNACAGGDPLKKGKTTPLNITGEDGNKYTVYIGQDDDGKQYDENADTLSQSAGNNELGLYLWVKRDRHTYGVKLNNKCMMDLLQKFYQEALG